MNLQAALSWTPVMLDEKEILIVFQKSLLGEVFPELRLVAVFLENEVVKFNCYYSGVLSDEDEESLSIIETNVIAALPSVYIVEGRLVRSDFPESLPKDGLWVYYRREDSIT